MSNLEQTIQKLEEKWEMKITEISNAISAFEEGRAAGDNEKMKESIKRLTAVGDHRSARFLFDYLFTGEEDDDSADREPEKNQGVSE